MRKQMELTLDMPVALAVQKYLQQYADDIRKAADAVYGSDEEMSVTGVHDIRVAIRKSIAVLDHFSPWIDSRWQKRYEKGFRNYLKKMGKLRDLDVLALQMTAEVEQGLAEAAWLKKVNRKRSKTRDKTIQILKDKAFLKWMGERNALLGSDKAMKKVYLPMCGDEGRLQLYTLADVLPAVVYQTGAELTVYQQALPPLNKLPDNQASDTALLSIWDDHSAELMHALRKTTKQCRYTLEILTSVDGFLQGELLQQLKTLQNYLGIWRDTWLACEWGWRQAEKDPGNQQLVQWLSRKQAEKQAARVSFDQLWPKINMAQIHAALRGTLDQLYK